MSVVQAFGGGSRGLGGREIAVWTVATFRQFLVSGLTVHQPLSNDSYQYLSVTETLRTGHGIETSLVHFDVERAHGTVPAPITTFPSGFPMAAAAVTKLGVPPTAAATAVS